MNFSILHPTRGRPQKSFETIKKWLRAHVSCNGFPEVIVSVDMDDPCLNAYINLHGKRVIVNHNRSAVDAINNAAKVCTGDIIIVVSDDTDCPDGWNDLLENAIGDRNDFIAKTPDGIQKWIITMPIMDRAYYNRFGYIYHPDYLHMFCDTELTCVADLTGRKIELDISFPHNHYSIGKSVKDAVSDRADKTWSQGESIFIERYKRNFDLVNTPGKITNIEYLNWIKAKI